jgi:adenosine kinase
MLATYVIETQGTQEYRINRDDFLERFALAYGDVATADVAEHIRCIY